MINRRQLFKGSALILGAMYMHNTLAKESVAAGEEFVPSKTNPLLLNFNENSLGMSPKAKEAVVNSLSMAFRYPDSQRADLIEAIAKSKDLTTKHVTIGNGSSEVIQSAVLAFVQKAKDAKKDVQLIVPDPTFNYAELYASSIGLAVKKVTLKAKTYDLDLPRMKKAVDQFKGVSIVYICNPNNPTATITDSNEIDQWVKSASADTYFIFDEAYAEFVTDKRFKSALAYVKEGNPNVIVTRTFSKIYAMAGLRMGYGIALPQTAAYVDSFASIDNTNLAGAVAAKASLEDDLFFQKSLQSNTLSRKIVTDALDELGLAYLPSQANFIFHQIKGDHDTYKKRMAEANVFVGREFAPAVGFNRLTLGTPSEMKAFVKVLKDFRKKGWI